MRNGAVDTVKLLFNKGQSQEPPSPYYWLSAPSTRPGCKNSDSISSILQLENAPRGVPKEGRGEAMDKNHLRHGD